MRLHITAGSPSDEEVAAVTVALLGLAAAAPHPSAPAESAWAVAARMEALGMTRFVSAADPRLQRPG